MKINSLLLVVVGVSIAFFACVKGTVLPVQPAKTIFKVNTKMTHSKDTILHTGDTVVFSVQGNTADTVLSDKYNVISATIKSTDTTGSLNFITQVYVKTLAVTYDTTGLASSGLYHWKGSITVPYLPVAAKTGIKTTATFTYGYNMSSELGTMTATDSKYIYVK